MSYKKYYEGGWRSGETGGTPITPEALNHMEDGIAGAVPTSRTVNGKPLSANISLGELVGVPGTPKTGAVVYSSIAEMGLEFTEPCTTEEFALKLPTHVNVQFLHTIGNIVYLKDTPVNYGTCEFHKGPNNNYIYGILVDTVGGVYVYQYHTNGAATNGWHRLGARTLWANASPTSAFGSQTLTVSGIGFCNAIAILFTNGSGNTFSHIVHREVSGTLTATPTAVYYNSGAIVVQRPITVNFSAKTIQFGVAKQNGSNKNETAIPLAVISLG